MTIVHVLEQTEIVVQENRRNETNEMSRDDNEWNMKSRIGNNKYNYRFTHIIVGHNKVYTNITPTWHHSSIANL